MNPSPGTAILAAAAPEKDPRWFAILARDPAADGQFYYSVRTTGVYCRPSCGARRPKSENVRFHASRAEAECAGFRPCKRCRPDEQPLRARQAIMVAESCRLIEAAEEPPSLGQLAARAGLSCSHFRRVFTAAMGLSPKAYADACRSKRVREQLACSRTVTEAMYDAGFNSSGRFYAVTDQVLGMRPTEYRAGGANADIRFAIGECSLGSILVAMSKNGVCAIFFGDEPDGLLRSLQDQFPRANLIGGDAEFEHVVATVVGFVEAPALGLALPLDIRGTAFQQRVWQLLREIPAGSTASYAELAIRLGQPRAVRAVARACAANPLAVAIPCHRVVRQDGALSGYRWGIERKRSLLDHEEARSRLSDGG